MNKRFYSILFVALAVGFMMAGCIDKGEIKDYSKYTPELSRGDKKYLLEIARARLNAGILPSHPPAVVQEPFYKHVLVGAFTPGHGFIVKGANKGSLYESVKYAATLLRREKALSGGDFDDCRLSIHIVDQYKDISTISLKKISSEVEPGYHGLMMMENGKINFVLGEEVLYHCWSTRGQKRVLGTRLMKKMLDEVSTRAKLRGEMWKARKIFRFNTLSFVEGKPGGKGKVLDLYRGNVFKENKITRSDLLESAVMGGRNLIINQSSRGKFGYIYYPCKEKFDTDYNFVRHAGTLYSLFALYRATGNPTFKEAGLNGLSYIKRQVKFPPDDPDIMLFYYSNKSTLGSNALLALALLEMPDSLLEENPRYKKWLEKVSRALLKFQMDDGSFYTRYAQVLMKKAPKEQAIYFPGETFLAFVRLYERTGEKVWLDAAVKAADYQIDDFKKTGVPDNWAIQAYSRLYRQKQDEKYAAACFEMADELLSHQWGTFKTKKMRYKDYFGGFDNAKVPRTTPTASRTEAITEAYHLAAFKKDEARSAKFSRGVMAAYRFITNNQYRRENGFLFGESPRALGGIKGSLVADDVRIDYTQHAIIAMLNGLEIAEKENGKGKLRKSLHVVDVAAQKISLVDAEAMIQENMPKPEDPQKSNKDGAGEKK